MVLNSNNQHNNFTSPNSLAFNNMFNKFLHKQGGRVLSRTCPKHKNQHLIQIGNQKPFCPIDVENKLDAKAEKDSTNYYYLRKKEHKQARDKYDDNFLMNHSILNDITIRNATFKNYETSISHKQTKSNERVSNELIKIRSKALGACYTFCFPQLTTTLVLAGPVGRGKSHIAMSIAKYVNKHTGVFGAGNSKISKLKAENASYSKLAKAIGKADKQSTSKNRLYVRCLFLDVSQMFQEIKNSWVTDRKFAGRLQKEIRDAYLVVFDDIGSEIIKATNNSWKGAFLKDILSSRQDKNNIITTNDSVRKIKQDYASRVYSRLFRNAGDHVIRFPKYLPDMRMVKN